VAIRDGWMIVPLPVGEPDPVRRLQLIAAESAQRKHEARPRTGSGVFGSLLLRRAFLRGFAHQRLMNTSVTNVPGRPVPLYLAGGQLLQLAPWYR
jgi:diacylglycerol O-acyltransferase / wax synthase